METCPYCSSSHRHTRYLTRPKSGNEHCYPRCHASTLSYQQVHLRSFYRAPGALYLRWEMGRENSTIPNKNGIRTDIVEALKRIKAPLIRWPGGCFADEYHWKDGIGPRNQRPTMINTNWGVWPRTTVLAPMNLWIFVNRWGQNLTSVAIWAAALFSKCRSGSNISTLIILAPWPNSAKRTAAKSRGV